MASQGRPTSDFLKTLTERAEILAEQVEIATSRSTNPELRRDGTRFAEVIEEQLEELKELVEASDERAPDRMAGFSARLRHAEDKVRAWYKPYGNFDAHRNALIEKRRPGATRARPGRRKAS